MNKLVNIVLKPMEPSEHVQLTMLSFLHDGAPQTWDILTVHDSVAIILYNISRNVLVFVKQFRPAVYLLSISPEDRLHEIDAEKYPAELGITIELCAGMVDNGLTSLEETAVKKVLQNCAYNVKTSMMEKISSYRTIVSRTGSNEILYYCEVTDDMKTKNNGIADKIIDVIEMTIPEVKLYIHQDDILSPPSFLFGVQWFLSNKFK